MKTILEDYLKHSSLHGLQYVIHDGNIVKQIIWVILVVTSIGLALFMVSSNLNETSKNPFTTTVELRKEGMWR